MNKRKSFQVCLLLNLFYLFCFDLIAKGNEGRKRIKRYPSIEEVCVYVFNCICDKIIYYSYNKLLKSENVT